MPDMIQCWDGDGFDRRVQRVHIECEHYAYNGTNITDTRKRAHVLLKLFGDKDVDLLRACTRDPLLWVEFRYLKGDRSISTRFENVTISRMKKKFNGWNLFLHYTQATDSNAYHG